MELEEFRNHPFLEGLRNVSYSGSENYLKKELETFI